MRFGLKLQAKGGLNNLDFSIRFQKLKIYYFEMALNTCEMWSNGIKIAIFSKKFQKTAQRLGASSPDHRLWHVWITVHVFTQTCLPIQTFSHLRYLFKSFPWTSSTPTPGHGFWSSILRYLCPRKKSSFEVSNDVSACDLWFAPLQSKILATLMLRNLAF